jgi:hypothetical protein
MEYMNVCIIYGWSEGHRHGAALRKALCEAGFNITTQPLTADIIIAHSIGCYFIPKQSTAKLILMVGLPHWPHKSIVRSTRQKIFNEAKSKWWYRKTLINVYYFFVHPNNWLQMPQTVKRQQLELPKNSNVLLIRNEYDNYLHPTLGAKLAIAHGWSYAELPGHHDDLWSNPRPYVTLIKAKTA